MNKEFTPAQNAYDAAVDNLHDFCDKYTDLIPDIVDEHYPIVVQFIPNRQLSIFGNRNIDDNGEVKELTVTVGLSTAVKSTLEFRLDAKLLKKLIKLAEQVGNLYYHAFREEHDFCSRAADTAEATQ